MRTQGPADRVTDFYTSLAPAEGVQPPRNPWARAEPALGGSLGKGGTHSGEMETEAGWRGEQRDSKGRREKAGDWRVAQIWKEKHRDGDRREWG